MKKLLKKHFGYENFRPLQKDIINNILAKKDTFVLMPTGGGKSLCFQLPALQFPGLTLVVSPLIALMKDQVDSLRANGVEAEFLNSSLDKNQITQVIKNVKDKKTKLLYVAPERFASQEFLKLLNSINLSLIAIDEAHCISEWGHDFRPEYRKLSKLKEYFPETPIVALTATATKKVQEDILRHLKTPQAKIFVSSFNRENLNIKVVEKKKAFPKLVSLLKNYQDKSVIIYCFSRKETEEIAHNLNLNNFNAQAYHAGIEQEERKAVQNNFINDQTNIIVATIAFGMGIDKPDVRLVVHYTFPKTIEGYYQEIGRAGRDGLQSDCVLFYTYADLRKHEYFLREMTDENQANIMQNKLEQVMHFAELSTCRKKYILSYFNEELEKNCGSCDICNSGFEQFDATIISQKILSAILKTNSSFGRNHIIDVLLGKNTQKIKINNHHNLSVYGIVDDYQEDELINIIKQLIDNGLLIKSLGKFPVLALSKKGVLFLKNNESLKLNKPKTDIKIRSAKKTVLDFDENFFLVLKELRKKIAQKENIPPFVVFGDKSLQEMAHYFPVSENEFLKISGVGEAKLKKYSSSFISLISDYTTKHNINSIKIPSKEIKEPKQITIRTKEYYTKTRELLQKKTPIKRIAKAQNLKESTIINHIEKLLDAGIKLNTEYLKLPLDRYKEIKKAFNECGDERLKPVYEYLDGKYDWDELRLVRVLLRQ